MRSSDAWLGWPYDIFSFSMISAFLALRLRMRGLKVDLGNVYLTAGSQHLYEKNYETARACTRSDEVLDRTYAPLELDQFNSSDEDFVEDLWRIARKQLARSDWLRELHS
jgi:thymidylate synthase